jgi:DNA-binding XRE family transcriptional regulator
VILPKADYDALVSRGDEVDLAAIEEFRTRRAAGEEEILPDAMVASLLAGEHPVKVWRKHRGLKRVALAERAGIAPGYLSEIEAGKKPGSIDVYRKIAKALDVTIDDLVR